MIQRKKACAIVEGRGGLLGALGVFEKFLGASWRPLGTSWDAFGLLGGVFWAISGHLEPSYDYFGAVLGRLGAAWGPSWAVLGGSRAPLGASWSLLEASCRFLGASWRQIGGLLRHLGVTQAHAGVLGPAWTDLGLNSGRKLHNFGLGFLWILSPVSSETLIHFSSSRGYCLLCGPSVCDNV